MIKELIGYVLILDVKEKKDLQGYTCENCGNEIKDYLVFDFVDIPRHASCVDYNFLFKEIMFLAKKKEQGKELPEYYKQYLSKFSREKATNE